jgi:glutathione S-transferase
MAPIKLTYFPVRGKGEFIRYILAQGGADYIDERIPSEDWPRVKPTTPMGQLPTLEENGKTICQSVAIARYCAKKFGLMPGNDWEAALADMMVDGVCEMMPHVRTINMAVRSGDDAKKAEAWNSFKTEHLPGFLDRFEKFLATNGTGYLVGKKLSWADIILAELLDRFVTCYDGPALLSGHPNMEKLMKMVHALPNIKKYVDGREKTSV